MTAELTHMAPPATGPPDTGFVGRRDDLTRLWDAIRRRPSVVFVEGPAGIGKSRLVRELRDRIVDPRTRVLVGQCAELREPVAYGAILDALRGCVGQVRGKLRVNPVAGDLGTVLPELADVLPAPVGSPGQGAGKHRLFRAVREVLGALGPVVLVVEDLHWADDGSVDLLRFLAGDPPPGLAVVVTYRGEDLRTPFPLGRAYVPPVGASALTLRPAPLDVDETRRMAMGLLGVDGMATGFAAQLREVTGGVPQIIEEVVRSLADPAAAVRADALRARGLVAEIPVPVVLVRSIALRLATTSTATRRVVRAAAVLGVPATVPLLEAVTGLPENTVATALAEAARRDLLIEAGSLRYGFRHQLARHAVYDAIDDDERRNLHVCCTRALEGVTPTPLVQLAEHAHRSDDRARWLRYGEAAADVAAEAGDVSLSTTLLRDLLTAPWMGPRDIDRLAVKLGRYATIAIEPPDTAGLLTELISEGRLSADVRGEARLYLGVQLLRTGHVAAGRAELEIAVTELDRDPRLKARCVALLMLPYHGVAPLDDVLHWSHLAESHLASIDDEEVQWALRANILSTRVLIGEPSALAEVRHMAPEVVGTAARRHVARMYTDCADGCVAIGRFVDAKSLTDIGTRWVRHLEAPHQAASEQAVNVRVDWFSGNWAGLAERAGAIRDQNLDLVPLVGEMSLVLGWLATVHGRWDEAEEHLLRTRAHRHQEAVTILALGGHGGLIRTHLGRRDVAAACQESDSAMGLLHQKRIWVWCGEMIDSAVTAYLAAGRVDDATAALDTAEAGIAHRDAPLSAAAIRAGRGRVAEHIGAPATAATHYERARELYREMDAPYFAALMTEASALEHTGSDDRSIAVLTEAADAYLALGAGRDESRCVRRIQALGGTRQKTRRGRVGYGSALSPRETAVGRLVVSGLSNKEIAKALTLSLRTVEHHVLNMLRKLGVKSRYDIRPWHFDSW